MIVPDMRPDESALRWFGLIWLPLGAFMAGVWIVGASGQVLPWVPLLAGIAAVSTLVGVFEPALLRPVYLALAVLAFPIGAVVSVTLLGAVFYLLVTPVALVRRLAGADALGLRDAERTTFWEPVEPDDDPDAPFRQY